MLDVVLDAMVDTHQVLGTILKTQVLLLDGYITHQIGVNLTLLLLVIIIQQANMSHVVPQSQLLNAKEPVLQDTQELMLLINGMHLQFTQFHRTLKKFKHKL